MASRTDQMGRQVQLSLPAQDIDGILREYDRGHLLRIIQEALDNVRNHAQTDRAQVIFATFSDSLDVIVSDDGVGFDVQTTGKDSVGLRQMHEHAARLGAELEIRSEEGRGTQVMLHVKRAKPDVVKPQLTKVTVLIADSTALVAEGLRSLLESRG